MSGKRVLIITPAVPYPVVSGQVTRTRNIIDAFRRLDYEIDLLLIVSSSPSETQLEALRKDGLGIAVHVLPSLLKACVSFYSPIPESIKAAFFPSLAAKMRELGPHTFVWCDGLAVTSVLSVIGTTSPVLVDFRDTLSRLYDQYARNKCNPIERLGMKILQRWRMAGEIRALKRYMHGFIISEVDKQWLADIMPSAEHLTVLPVVIDVQVTDFSLPPFPLKEWLFIGDLRYPPNMESVLFLVRLMKEVAARYPDWRLTVVGKAPSGWSPPSVANITFAGFVETIEPYLERAGAVLCPIFSGTGIKNKVLMAMASKRPIIANRVALEGIPAIDGKHVLIAETLSEFENTMARLAVDRQLAELMLNESYRLVFDQFSIKSLAVRLKQYLDVVLPS